MPKCAIPLLPCPWCGSENVSLEEEGGYVECNECSAHGPDHHPDTSAAMAAWNNGPYIDRLKAHSEALIRHAEKLKAKAAEHIAKAEELLKKAEGSNG